jgi:serine/threonine-protein kinase RsbW
MDTLCLPATMENVETFRSFVLHQMERLETKRQKVLLVELGLEEFLTNVVKYAYPQDGGNVEVGCYVDGNGMFCVFIRDWGVPFNPLLHEDPDFTEDLCHRRVGGLGIFLVRKMFDEVRYEREEDGNLVTLCCRQ